MFVEHELFAAIFLRYFPIRHLNQMLIYFITCAVQ